ncbi:MAG: flagellin [Phycisphaerae bacterium]
MLAIKNNLMAEQAARQLGNSYDHLTKSVARLSSGLRINTASDDAAGLAVRELIRADVAVLKQGARNGRDAISMLQTAEGAMGVTDDILVRMRELAEQSSTESYSSAQRSIMHAEFSQLIDEIDRIANNTEFNELNLLNDETGGAYQIHLGSAEMIQVDRADMTSSGLSLAESSTEVTLDGITATETTATGYSANIHIVSSTTSYNVSVDSAQTLTQIASAINAETSAEFTASTGTDADGNVTIVLTAVNAGSSSNITDISIASAGSLSGGELSAYTAVQGSDGVSINSAASARIALNSIESAIKTKDQYRAKLGYLMNRLESATSVIDIQAENLLAAESRISDVDVASEMAAMTRHQVLAQAGISMLSQANTMPQMALSLLG